MVAAFGLLIIPMHWVALLGIVPLALGLWRLAGAIRSGPEDNGRARPTASVGTVALIAIINGADNLAVYTPVFRTEAVGEVFVTLIVFLVMIGAWCVLAAWLGHHLGTVKAIARVSHLAVPLVFIAIGIVLLTRLSLFPGWAGGSLGPSALDLGSLRLGRRHQRGACIRQGRPAQQVRRPDAGDR